jgi:hypothetical protein
MKKKVMVLTVLVFCIAITGISFAAPTPKIKADSPLPTEVNIVVPAADVAPELAAFFGTWIGTWEWDYYPNGTHNKRDAVIIVEKIDGNNVHMIFSWGGKNFGTGWVRVVGTYSPELYKLTVPLKSPMVMEDQNATLRITREGKMVGHRNQYIHDGNRASDYKGIYTKQP